MLKTKLFFTLKEAKNSKTFRFSFCFRWKIDFKNFWWIHVCCVKRWLESVSQLTYYCLYKIIPKLFREHQIYSSTYMKIYFSINIHITCIYIIQILLYYILPMLIWQFLRFEVLKTRLWNLHDREKTFFSNIMFDWIRK